MDKRPGPTVYSTGNCIKYSRMLSKSTEIKGAGSLCWGRVAKEEWVGAWEGDSREGMYVFLQLSHTVHTIVKQLPSNLNFFQLNNNRINCGSQILPSPCPVV